MKKILSNTLLLAAGLLSMVACSEDRDSNPTLTQPSEFVLNEASVKGATVDLARTSGVDLTWSQPQYTINNAPVIATYSTQVSAMGSFNKEYNANAKDDAENEGADFITLEETTTYCNTSLKGEDIDKAIQQLCQFGEDEMPASMDIKIRVKSEVKDASGNAFFPVLSNEISIKVAPYYYELKNATPVMWYLVGNMFGAKWGSDIGETALPMFLRPDYEYNKKTGEGVIEYLNWFGTGEYNDKKENGDYGFKIQRSDFNWDWGMTGNGKPGNIICRNGGDDGGHIVAPADGYYTITMNTETKTASMVPYEEEVKDYGTIQLSGSFNGWSDTPMLPYNKEGVENHAWYYVMTVTPDMYNADHGVCEFKFKIEGSWDTNWGFGGQDGAVNMYGTCGAGQSNLGLKEGKYVISFNDITGAFSIVAL